MEDNKQSKKKISKSVEPATEDLLKIIKGLQEWVDFLTSQLSGKTSEQSSDKEEPVVMREEVPGAKVRVASICGVPAQIITIGDDAWLALPYSDDEKETQVVWVPFNPENGLVQASPALYHACREYLEACNVGAVEPPYVTDFTEWVNGIEEASDNADYHAKQHKCGSHKCRCKRGADKSVFFAAPLRGISPISDILSWLD